MGRVVGGLALLVVLATPSPGWAKQQGSTVTVVHGLPRFTADIYVNGELTLSGFKPKETTDPFELPADDYLIEIRDAGSAADSEPALSTEVTVPTGKNLSIVAHLTEDGTPTVSVFENDVSRIRPGRSHLLVRHQAQAPPIDVEVDGTLLFRGLASSEQASRLVPPGTAEVSFLGVDGESLMSAEPVELDEGAAYFLYLIGSSEEETLDLMVQAVAGLQTGPSGIATGDGGLAAEAGFPGWASFLMAASAAALGASILVQLRRRWASP